MFGLKCNEEVGGKLQLAYQLASQKSEKDAAAQDDDDIDVSSRRTTGNGSNDGESGIERRPRSWTANFELQLAQVEFYPVKLKFFCCSISCWTEQSAKHRGFCSVREGFRIQYFFPEKSRAGAQIMITRSSSLDFAILVDAAGSLHS